MTPIYAFSAAPHLPEDMKSVIPENSGDEPSYEGIEFGLDHELF